ncbi:MAG: hypothetical protein ABI193_03155 [Minicystis sp.]
MPSAFSPVKVWSVLLGAFVLGACSGGYSADDPPAVCSTNKTWTNGDKGSVLMHPGGECNTCHSQGEGPALAIAGTVMGATNDDTNCDGVSGVTVEITDKTGQKITLLTNVAGNFSTSDHGGPTITFPITAKVISGGKELAMTTPQNTGDCNTCHGAVGTNGAPGRLTVP